MSLSTSDDDSAADIELLTDTNKLLNDVGLVDFSSKSAKKVGSIEELRTVASSMFVAVYEAKFRVRLEGVVRNPINDEDYAQNVQLVIDALQDKIHIGLQHITGVAISNGDKKAISNLIRILSHVVTNTGQPSISSSDSLSTVESADTTSSPSSVTSYEGDVYYDDYLNTSARRGRRRSSTSTQRLIEEQQQKIAKHQRLLEKSLAKMPAPLLPTQRRPLSTGVRKRSTTPVNAYKNKTGTKNEYSHRYAYNRPNPNVSKNTSGRTVEYVPNRTSSSHRGRVYSMNSTNMNKSRRSAPSLRFGESPTIQSRKGWNDSTKSFHSPKAKPVKTKVHPLVQPAWVDQVASPLKEKINDAVRTSYNQLVDTTKHLNAMCDKDAQECAQQMTGLQKWTDKLEAARKRKEDIAQVANMKSIEYNRRHDENACRIKEKRWAADLLRESESFEQKLKSQDYVLLKQAYRDLLKQLQHWKLEEHKEIKDRLSTMKENAKHHITSLERLYDDRVHLLQEQQRSVGKESAMGTDAAKRNVRNIKNASRESSGLNHKHMVLRQQRERMLLQRQEALKKLNDLNHMLLTSNVNANSLRSKSNPQANNKGKKSLQRRDYVRRSSRDRPTRPDPSNLNTIRTINDQNYYYNNIDSTTIPTSTTSYSADIDNSNTTLTPTTSISSGSSIDSLPFNDYQYEPVDTNVFDMINNINSNIAQKDLEMGYSDAAELNVLDGLDSMGLHSSTNGNISGNGNRYDDVEYPEPGPDDASDELNGSDSFNGSSDSTPNMLHSQ